MPTYEELIEALVSKNTLPFSKVGIISSLMRLRDTRAIPYFIEALNDENHYVRREAAQAIGQLGSSESTAALLGVLEGEADEETRRNVLLALGNIGDDRAVETLQQALKDPSYWIRRAAEMGLKQLQKRLEMQQPVGEVSATSLYHLDTAISEKSVFVEGPTGVKEIPGYRELTNSISPEFIVKPSKINETTAPTSETITDETVSNEYRANILPTLLRMSDEQTVSQPPLFPPPIPPVYGGEQGGGNTWRCNRCGDEVDSYYDVCQTCGGRRGEPGKEEILSEEADLEAWFEKKVDLNCPKCGEKMLAGYLFTQSDDALIFNYQEENDVVIGRGTQMGFICLTCNLISFPFRGKRQYVREGSR
ncbi:HEAT repeat domain-containing protein [Candidatus Poribacteria bacterium]|nr:HEAT repeat domain-containing protein [Candidatus Poribacteria bacterium]